ncbi:phenylalanine--tRNA ligase subunit alpha [Parvularcula marina]|uniref:phenylalanine--tRNA ligase subunit alpha n=1 Tax=Parvularcula marina TaxID=2292771 RepID=UPI003512A38D
MALDDLPSLESEILSRIKAARDEREIEEIRVWAFGKKSRYAELKKSLGKREKESAKELGLRIHASNNNTLQAWSARRDEILNAALEARLKAETVDVTLPVDPQPRGKIHPVSQVFAEIEAIFADMGFSVRYGPDIEDDFHNFTALNFPPGHPAREMHDTFFFEEKEDGSRMVLRTHTSPVQVRTMTSEKPPIRIIAPGRTFRCDSDQTHTPMFHQVEGLVIDKETHMGHLKGTLEAFVKRFFEIDDLSTRFRPHFFPFTEPSAEMDVAYERVDGAIKFGQGDKWMEILGCGMVHPNVLKNCGLDPDEYQGFAFGMGVDRLAMLKYGIPDLRDFFSGDTRWLEHYGF